MIHLRRPRAHRQRGQGLVEFALVLPIMAVLVVSVVEVGLIYGAMQSLGYAARDAARVGAALAKGPSCPPDTSLPPVDAIIVGAAQRILKSPDSGISLPKVQQIRIFNADANGREIAADVNTWRYQGPQAGPDVNPGVVGVDGNPTERIDFVESTNTWAACDRENRADPPGTARFPESIGVTVQYRYDFVTPMGAVLRALAGGNLSVTLTETTVMALNPTV